MQQYLDTLRYVLDNGKQRQDRTGQGTIGVFGHTTRYDLSKGFPLITTKKIHFHSVVVELLWFLKGDTNIKFLQENGVRIWNEWADDKGNLGPLYGQQWRNWRTPDYTKRVREWDEEFPEGNYNIGYELKSVDQIKTLIDQIKTNPCSRRLIVNGWNVGELDQMRLPPCHGVPFQFYVEDGKRLSCQMYQRSGDLFLGIPFNIASYSLLTSMIAQVCDLEPWEFIHVVGDLHLYSNHLEQAKEQLTREPKPLPSLWLNPEIKDIDSFKPEDIKLVNYESHPVIKAKVAV